MADTREIFERKDDQLDRLASLYGLTPKVESAIIGAVQSGAVHRLRTLVAPLHPADQADLLERLPTRSATSMVRLLGDHLDAETFKKLKKRLFDKKIKFIDPPYIRFKGEDIEQETMFLEDPNGNCMEIKTMKNPTSLFEGKK